MTRAVVTTRSDARLREAARLLREVHISGLPVLDGDERLVGVLSERDIVRVLGRATGATSARGLLDIVLGSAPSKGLSLLEAARACLRGGRVREAMSAHVVTIRPSATIREASVRMRSAGVNRLPVVGPSGRLIGILSRADVVDALSGRSPTRRSKLLPPPTRSTSRRRAVDPYSDI